MIWPMRTESNGGFQRKTVYQIYPRSFFDSTGDGVGDLRGVIQKITYIASLGVDMVWFNPFFVSPQVDNGYDISDYYRIAPEMGTMADFEELVAGLRAEGIDVMLDMVLNHTSTEHDVLLRRGLGRCCEPVMLVVDRLIGRGHPRWGARASSAD